MMFNSLDAAAADLLRRVKLQRAPENKLPRLCSVFREAGHDLPMPRVKWILHGGGQMAYVMNPVQGEQLEAARRLLGEGQLVHTWADSEVGEDFYQIEHFDDLNWARTDRGSMLVYRLNEKPDHTDYFIPAADIPDALKRYSAIGMDIAYTDGDPFVLKGHGIVTPVLTNGREIALRERQVMHKTGVPVPRTV